jgi:signal transduction histidine kinase
MEIILWGTDVACNGMNARILGMKNSIHRIIGSLLLFSFNPNYLPMEKRWPRRFAHAAILLIFSCTGLIAQPRLDSLKNLLTTSTDSTLAQVHEALGAEYKLSNQVDLAVQHYQAALDFYRTRSNDRKVAGLYQEMGATFKNGDRHSEAIQSYLKASELWEKIGNKKEMASIQGSMVEIFMLQRDKENAMEASKKQWKLLEGSSDKEAIANAHIFRGRIYIHLLKFDSAAFHYGRAVDLFRETGNRKNIGFALHNLANANRDLHHYETSLKYATEALTFKSPEDKRSWVYTILLIANIYMDMGDQPKAVQYALEGLRLAEENKLSDRKRVALLYLSQSYEKAGNAAKSLEYHKLYTVMQDSIFNTERYNQFTSLKAQHETEKKEQLIEIQNANLKAQDETITRQYYVVVGFSMVAILIAIILVVVYRNNLKIKALNKVIESSNRTKDRLFSIISHDLRGPIAAFETTPRILRNYLNKNQPEKVTEVVDHIDRSARHLNQLLDNLLNWSLSQREELVINIEKLGIKPIMDDVIEVFKDAASVKKITIASNIGDQFVMADRNTFSTVVRNLLSNSIKFSHPGSTITIDHRVVDNWIEFKFTDSGTGMNENQLAKLFIIDKSKVRNGTAMEKGTGLGMVLIKEFVEINNGQIKVESKLDLGTTFYVSLPLAS